MEGSITKNKPENIRPGKTAKRLSLQHEISNNVLKMFGARILQIPIQIIRVFFIPRLLSPANYGLWRSLELLNQYSVYLQLGTHQCIVKEMPYLAGAGELKKRQIIYNNAFYYNLFAFLLLGIGLLCSSFFTQGEWADFYAHGFRVFAFVLVIFNLNSLYQQYLRIEKEFSWLGIITTLTPAINVALSVVLLIYLKNVLVLAYAMLIANGLSLFLLIKHFGIPAHESVTWIEMWRQIKVGFPLMSIAILSVLIVGVDQLMILFFLGAEELGYYGLAYAVQSLIFLIPSVIGSTLVPYLFEDYGRTNSAVKSSSFFMKPTIIISVVSSVAIALALVIIHLPVCYFLTQYKPGLPVLYVLLMGYYGMSLIMVAANFVVICGKTRLILWAQLISLVISVVSNYIVIKLGYGIIGVSCATCFTYFVYSFMILAIAIHQYIEDIKVVFKKIVFLYVPFFFMCLSYTLVVKLLPNDAIGFWQDLQISLLRCACIFLMFLPLIVYYDCKVVRLSSVIRR